MRTQAKPYTFDPQARLAKLNGRRFLMEDLESVALDANTVHNYLHKSKLRLCSESPGRGRARKFCLIDVYLLSLKSHIVTLTGSAIAASHALHDLVIEGMREEDKVLDPAEEEVRVYLDNICEDILQAAPLFSDRGREWFIYTSSIEHGFDVETDFDPMKARKMLTQARCMFLNVTEILNGVDMHLIAGLEKRYGEDF